MKSNTIFATCSNKSRQNYIFLQNYLLEYNLHISLQYFRQYSTEIENLPVIASVIFTRFLHNKCNYLYNVLTMHETINNS